MSVYIQLHNVYMCIVTYRICMCTHVMPVIYVRVKQKRSIRSIDDHRSCVLGA